MTISATDIKKLDSMCPVASRAKVGTRLGLATQYGVPFRKTVTLTAAAAATSVSILTEAEVNGGTVYIDDAILAVTGATAWTDSSGTVVRLKDTTTSPNVVISYAKAQVTGNATLWPFTTGATAGAQIKQGAGVAIGKGLVIDADSNFDAGSDIKMTVTGFISGANV
jgi:hypothetical protein